MSSAYEDRPVFELPDGSHLLFDAGPSQAALDELETWSLIADDDATRPSDEHRGDPVVWASALTAGSLALAAVQGVIGNAAWAVFPAAARFLRSLRDRKPKDAAGAVEIARVAVIKIHGGDSSDVVIETCERTAAGTWSLKLTHGTTRLAVLVDTSGAVVQVRNI